MPKATHASVNFQFTTKVNIKFSYTFTEISYFLAKKFLLQISAESVKKNYKIDHVSKSKNRTEKVLFLIYFWVPKMLLLNGCSVQTRHDVIWNFTPIIFLAHGASFMSRWPLLRGRGSAYSQLGNNHLTKYLKHELREYAVTIITIFGHFK